MLAHAGLMVPFRVAGERLRYQGNVRMQYARTRILPSDYFVIGNRYSVRGFDEQLTLAAESGITWRNDLAWQLGNTGQEAFVGFDMGHVSGPTAGFLVGQSLMGAVDRRAQALGHVWPRGPDLRGDARQAGQEAMEFFSHTPNIAAQIGVEF
ncbi:ShlB/FhaC/HecB family hemolysin secretion/activation protein [Cupriavidus basilensis]